ncbi:MAG TPA: VCBS repeat-containing protein [Phycisphaerae bacterium]|nr:VCBS repeat-containing protein [Phycisphaerae bacterium]
MRTLHSLAIPAALGMMVIGGCELFLVAPQKDLVDPLFETTAGAKAIVLGDINGDGLTDVASISSESQPVQIHLRNPLTFRFDTYTIAGGAPLSILADLELADLNGDGRPDIVVLVNDTGFMAPDDATKVGAVVMLIQGADPTDPADWIQVSGAGAAPPANLSFASNEAGATDLVVGDFDMSNGPDIVVLSNETDARRVHLYANPGAAGAADPAAWTSTVIEQDASDLGKAEAVDLDRDGDLDVVMSVPTAKSFNLRWLQNPRIQLTASGADPPPTFVPDTVDPLLESTAGAKATALGDIDGDGLMDIASISDESQPVQIHLRNAATGHFDTISIAGGAPLTRSQDIELADFDGDGKLDIAVLVNDTGYAVPELWRQDKIGALVVIIQGADPRDPSAWTRVDAFNQLNPLIRCIVDSPPVGCDMQFGTGEIGCTDMVVADFTNDGLPDIVVDANGRDQPDPGPTKFVYLFPSPGPGAVTDPANWTRQIITTDVTDFARLAAADLDEDGSQDVVITMPEGKSFNISWSRNIADGANWERVFLGQQQGGGNYIAVGDINGDSHIDLASGSISLGLVQWFQNPGPAALAPGAAQVPWYVYNIGTVTTGALGQVQLVDLDDDGRLDCFATGGSAGVGFQPQAHIQHTWDSFLIFEAYPAATIGQTIFHDFDGDGRIDFVAPFNRTGLIDDRFVLYKSMAASLWHRRLVGQQQGGADAIALGDIDRDGNVDVAAAGAELMVVQWFHNPGSGRLLPTSPQVPWDVFTLGRIEGGQINQVQLVDLNSDQWIDAFITADGTAFEFYRGLDVEQQWGGTAMFRTDPKGQIGRTAFLDLNLNGLADIIAPVDRDNLTDDQIVIFPR